MADLGSVGTATGGSQTYITNTSTDNAKSSTTSGGPSTGSSRPYVLH